jgi:hypothetical protein
LTTRPLGSTQDRGLTGPVPVFAALLLLMAAPLMRGGNRQVALIVLEAISLGFLLTLWLRAIASQHQPFSFQITPRSLLIGFLLLSPAWLALVYLTPLPAGLWSETAGRAVYLPLLREVGVTPSSWLPLSPVPEATVVSLLAGIPLVAGFLIGYLATLPQLKLLLGAVVAMAFAQIALGLLQAAGGAQSFLYFGGAGGRPFGTFANANHFANYLAMALAAYVWLGWSSARRRSRRAHNPAARFASHHAVPLLVGGGLVLVLGILMSRSRGAGLTGLPASMLAMALAYSMSGRANGWRSKVALAGGVLAGALALVGLGAEFSRFEVSGMTSAASVRGMLASTTIDGAGAFWPLGAGWGSYAAVYPRFQPMGFDGLVDYAHHDYAHMLFEGGIFAVMLAAAFLWLAGSRAVLLIRLARRHRSLNRDEMVSALCGLGLLGLLLHSLVDFNMHIPANAILGAMLAGVYLRPLENRDAPV